MLGKTSEFLDLQNNEILPLIGKLNSFIDNVRRDIRKKRISETEGQKLILKTTRLVSTLMARI